MACGTFLHTYGTEDNPFRDGVHCRIYDPSKPKELADMIRYYLAHEEEREGIVRAGLEQFESTTLPDSGSRKCWALDRRSHPISEMPINNQQHIS